MRAVICLVAFLLSSCAWILDDAAGFPASDLISDVKTTSDEIKEEKHQERVEELNKDYEEFLRSQEAPADDPQKPVQSIVIKQDDDET